MISTLPDRIETNSEAGLGSVSHGPPLGWLVSAGLAVSLVVKEGASIAPVLMLIAGAWALIRTPRQRFGSSQSLRTLLICFAAYAFGSAVMSLLHRDPLGQLEQYLPFLGATLIAVACRANALSTRQLAGGFAAGTVVGGIASVVQVVAAAEIHRASFFTTTNTLGCLGTMYAVICGSALGWPEFADRRFWRGLLFAGSMGGMTVSLLSGAKGTWVPLALIGPVVFLQSTRGMGVTLRAAWALAVVAMIVAVSLLPNSPVLSRTQSFIQGGDAFRTNYWQEGLRIIRGSPVAGVGRTQIRQQLESVAENAFGRKLPGSATADLHSEYIDVTAARGGIGLLLTLSALAVPLLLFARCLRFNAPISPATTGILFVLAFAICGFFDVQFQIAAKRMTYVFSTVVLLHFASRPAIPSGDSR